MSSNLVIVESPAKAKTISKYLGKDFKVLSSVGHIRSIPKKTKDGTPPIDIPGGFVAVYEVDPEKQKVASELKKAVKQAGEVWLATDEDREGEAIAWHLCEVLGLDPKKTKRIVFHEITKDAINEAAASPRTISMDLVSAQQTRQILDRIVGFELSPVVWQKVPGGKSAGRVQSPAVRLLVEREREIEKFESSSDFKVNAIFKAQKELKAELNKRFDSETKAKNFLDSLIKASFAVNSVAQTPGTRNPSAPFTTSTLQQEANARLGFSAKATMSAAQKLYQEGKITYMRTDSVSLSGQAIAQISKYVKESFGEEYHQVRNFQTKSKNAQEAHEAIRPTNISREVATTDTYAQKLYDLIRRRTLASQMAPAKVENTLIKISISGSESIFEAKGETIIFDGFLKVYKPPKKDSDILPSVKEGEVLKLESATARQVFAKPPARYTEGSLVKKLEELGIGRPSTYATILNTIQERGYAEKGESEGEPRDVIALSLKNNHVSRDVEQENTGADRGKLVPTSIGKVMSDFLTDHFDQIVDYGFTADVEEEFDQIAAGKLESKDMLKKFYTPFHKLIEGSDKIDRSKVAQARKVGKDPKTDKTVFARIGRYGPMLQLGESGTKDNPPADEDKPRFAPLPKGAKIETVKLEEALEMFKLPRVVGTTSDEQEITANIGRFGPYIQVGKLFVSLKDKDPLKITEGEARRLYAAKLKSEAEKNIADFGEVKVLNGRFGPYVTDGKKNAKIPKDKDPKKITEEQAKKILAEAPDKKPRFTKRAAK